MRRVGAWLTIGLELAALGYLAWRHLSPYAPGLDELAERFWVNAQARAEYEQAIRRTLAQVRALPETEGR